jgi:zinc transport system permease protein
MIKILLEMFSYAFLVRALVVGLLVSLCASLLGVSLVLKRYSMIGDGLSHVGFGALALATAMNMAPLAVSIPVVVLAAFLLLRLSENSKIKGDAAIALISTGAVAIGVFVISVTTGMNTDVCNYMFGSILAMSKSDVTLSVVLSAAVLIMFVLFYHKIFAITFDETFARASGVKAGVYNMMIALLTAVTIVLGMRMMGAMLISSLILFPALTSMRICKKFKTVTVCSAFVSVICFFTGIVLSYIYAIPSGASVVIINILAFLVFWMVNLLKGNVLRRAVPALFVFLVISCGGKGPVLSTPKNQAGTRSVVLPEKIVKPAADTAIEITEKMFIAQTNDVYLNPEDYMGKTIKIAGLMKSESSTVVDYHFVIRYGPGCCGNDGTAGFEVAWDTAPEDYSYPKEDEWVEAVGVLSDYEEDGFPFLYLALSSLTVKKERGAEFVSQ